MLVGESFHFCNLFGVYIYPHPSVVFKLGCPHYGPCARRSQLYGKDTLECLHFNIIKIPTFCLFSPSFLLFSFPFFLFFFFFFFFFPFFFSFFWGGLEPCPGFPFFLFFFFFPFGCPSAYRVPGQGSDPSHGCDLCHSCTHAGSFTPLCWARHQTCILVLQRRH